MTDTIEKGGTSRYAEFYSSDYYGTDNDPTLYITYVNNSGLEGYWDYHTQSAGRAGTGYVNDFTGNLVWTHSDMGYSGNLAPVSISHVYNANDKDNNDYGMGYGWRTNYSQQVYKSDITHKVDNTTYNYYVWEDEDGTRHYFRYTNKVSGNEVYEDESGIELTLTVVKTPGTDGIKYKLNDKNGNTSSFDTEGRLTKIENNQQEKSAIKIAYKEADSKLISTITDGAGRVYKFLYGNNILTQIMYYGTTYNSETSSGTVIDQISFVTFNYELVQMTYKDGEYVRYSYYDDNHLLKTATDIDGYTLTYEYNTTEGYLPNRVSKITEKDGDVSGGSLDIEYSHNETTFTDHTGTKEIYQFNYYGNTISIQNEEGQAVYATYARNDAGSTGKANQLILSSKLQNTVKNFVYDSSFDGSGYWDITGGDIETTKGYIGSKSAKISSTTATGSAIIAPKNSWQYVTVPEAGETYTFSAYVLTESMNGGKVELLIEKQGGTDPVAVSEAIDENSEWTRVEVNYTTKTANEVLKYKVRLTGVGTAYVDCLQFEKMPTASRYNLIQNGDFSYAGTASTVALGWAPNASDVTTSRIKLSTVASPLTTESAAPQLDDNVLSITGNAVSTEAKPTRRARQVQELTLSGSKGDVYTLAGWAIGNAAPMTDTYRKFALVLQFFETTSSTAIAQSEFVYFNEDVGSENNWQYAAGQIVAKQDYGKIKVFAAYDYNINVGYFDGIQLFKEEFGHSYVYDEDGNVVSVTDLQQSKTDYEYEDNDLTKMVLSSGATYEYKYDDYHNVLKATSAEKVTNTFEYNEHGLNTSVSVIDKNNPNGLKITASATYTTDNNYMATQTDMMGNKTSYVYDSNTGELDSVTVEDSTATNYTYDENTVGRLTEVSKNVSGLSGGLSGASVSYEYEDDYLTKITHSNTSTTSTTYNFAYGNFGLLNSVKVGTRSLISHTYNGVDMGFALARSTYGNGHTVAYTYDDELRTESITYNDGTVVGYKYDNNGNLGTMIEEKNGETVRSVKYLYDAADRLMKVESDDLTVGWGYDDLNNLTSQKYQVDEGYFTYNIRGDVEIVTSYTYDKDNRPTKITSKASDSNTADDAGLVMAEYDYDVYGRNNSTEYLYGENTSVLTRTIGYANPTAETTTSIVHTLNNHTNLYDKTYTYTYDDQGNITSTFDGTSITTYEYDELNQLTRENNQAAGKTWTYTYNAGGNITAKREYTYTTGTLGTELDTIPYVYESEPENSEENTAWGDLLISYDGQTISSDAIGNMLNDGTWTYTWQNGQQLAGMTKSGISISYTYNSDGLRTSKTVNGVTTKYLYYGDQLIGMDTELGTVYFHYDSTGVVAMELGSTVLYYVKNAQGDIVALVDINGYPVAEYTYDAGGDVINITGLYATTYGMYNPFRYRGYVYDTETKLYYLQTRYYSPEMCRFINADAFVSTGQGILGNNMFTYCNNNPVLFADYSGMVPYPASAYINNSDSISAGNNQAEMRDVTDEIMSALAQASLRARQVRATDRDYSKVLPVYLGFLGTYVDFLRLVYHGQPWDIKRQEPWESTIGTVYPGKDVEVSFLGMIMTPEYLGNFTYGYLGYSYGIPLEILLIGSYCVAGCPTSGESLRNEFKDWLHIRMGYNYAKNGDIGGIWL